MNNNGRRSPTRADRLVSIAMAAAVIAAVAAVALAIQDIATNHFTLHAATTTTTTNDMISISQAGRTANNVEGQDCNYEGGVQGEGCSSTTWPVCTYSGVNETNHVEWWCHATFTVGGDYRFPVTIGLGPYNGVLVNNYTQPAVPQP